MNRFYIFFLIFVHCLIISSVAHAENRFISQLEVSVNLEGTSIWINIPADFTYTEYPEKNEIELRFDNCLVNLLGNSSAKIPSFSPIFESIEVSSVPETNCSIMVFKLGDKAVKPVIAVQPGDGSMKFNFTSGYQVAKLPPEVVQIPKQSKETIKTEPVISDEAKPGFSETVLLEPWEDKKPEFAISTTPEPVVQIPKIKHENLAVGPAQTLLDATIPPEPVTNEIVEPISENVVEPIPDIPVAEQLAKYFKEATLDAIHYTQGKSDRDVISLEFTANSPEFNYEINEAGCVVVTLHNLITPEAILSGEEIKREVHGRLIKAISLKKFTEIGLPALQIMLISSRPLQVEVQDYEGFIDLTIRAGGG